MPKSIFIEPLGETWEFPDETSDEQILAFTKQNVPKTETIPATPSESPQVELLGEEARQLPNLQATTEGGGRAPLASFSETINEPMAELTNPLITLPRLKINEGESKPLTVAKEAVNIAAGLPEFMSSKLGVTSTVAAPASPLLVGGTFLADTLHTLGKQIQQSYSDWDKMTPTQKTTAVTDMVGTGIFAALLGHGATRGKAPTPAESAIDLANKPLTTGEPNAPSIRIEQKSNQPEHIGVPRGENLPAYVEKVRQEESQRTGSSGGNVEGGQVVQQPPRQNATAGEGGNAGIVAEPPKPAAPEKLYESYSEAEKDAIELKPGDEAPVRYVSFQPGVKGTTRTVAPIGWFEATKPFKSPADNSVYYPAPEQRVKLTQRQIEANGFKIPESEMAKFRKDAGIEQPKNIKPEKGLPESATESDLMADMTEAGRDAFRRAKSTPDEFTSIDVTKLSNADRRNLARLGLSFSTDRSGKVQATYPARMRAEDLRKAVLSKQTPPSIIGMGGAVPGEVPKAPQIEQLTKAFSDINAQKVPLREKIKRAFDYGNQRDLSKDLLGRTISGIKTAGDYLIDTWRGQTDVDPVLKAKGQLSAAIEQRGWLGRQAMKQMKKAVPDVRLREAISKYVDAGGDMTVLQEAAKTVPENRRAAYQRAMALTPEEKTMAGHVQSYFESRLQEAIDAGVVDEGITDYIHRIYPKETPWKKGVINSIQNGVLNTRKPGLAMKRLFQFDADAERAGLKPIGDFVPRILDYEQSLSKAIASREAVKRFTEIKMPDGRPMLDAAGIGVPIENAEGVREATLIKPSFKPNAPELSEGKANKNYRRDYQARDYPALRKWKWASTDANGNPIMVQGDVLIHPDAVHRIDALLEPSKLRKYGAARVALAAGSTFKQTMLDFSGFHQVQIAIHGMEHKVNPFNLVKDINFEDPNINGLLRGGMTLGGEHVGGLYAEGLVGRSLSRQIPGLGPLMESYHSWLFQDFIPRMKTTMALHALERNRARFAKDLKSGKMTEDALYHQTAKEANAAFGELNYIMLERSKTAQDLSRLILLAPDFLEARGRFALQAATRLGGEQRMALLLGALTMWTTARIANKAINDEWHLEPENAFSIIKDGKAYSMRTVQGDILHAIEEPVRFWLNRLNPTITRPMFEMMTGRDAFGRKRDFWQVIGDNISNIVPISMRSNKEQRLWQSMLNAFGGAVRRYSETKKVYDIAQEWKKANKVREEPGEFIYDPDKDIYRPLKLSLLDGKTEEAAIEYKKMVAAGIVTPKQIAEHFKRYASAPFSGSLRNERRFYNSLSEENRKAYQGAKQEKQRIYAEFQKALGIVRSKPRLDL